MYKHYCTITTNSPQFPDELKHNPQIRHVSTSGTTECNIVYTPATERLYSLSYHVVNKPVFEKFNDIFVSSNSFSFDSLEAAQMFFAGLCSSVVHNQQNMSDVERADMITLLVRVSKDPEFIRTHINRLTSG